MKNILLSFVFLFLTSLAYNQPLTGTWEGKLSVNGTELPVIFHIKKDSTGKLNASFDSPLQKAYNLPCSDVTVKEDSVIFLMKILNGRYASLADWNKKQLTGTWYQGGGTLPLTLLKTSDVAITKEIKRPQTPKPPYPYNSDSVEYYNADKSIRFGATCTYPFVMETAIHKEAELYPAVILITGSGQQDRDENIFNHRPFAVIADHLTKNGIIVLRVDDRGKGRTTGNFSKSTTADFADDVQAGIAYLKQRGDVDVNRIGLIGHSEGGMIAPMVAAKNKDIAFIVLLAGPGIPIVKLMEQQNMEVMMAAGVVPQEVEQFRPLYNGMVKNILAEKDTAKAIQKNMLLFRQWQKGKTAAAIKNTTAVTNEKEAAAYVSDFVKSFSEKWFSYFIRFNPANYLSKVKCPVLALNGSKDVQVASQPNLTAIKNILTAGKNNNVTVKELPGLNHLFQHCKKCDADEYADLEESFSPEALQIMSDWILNTVSKK